MDLGIESLRVLVTLLPGFLSARVEDFFLPPRKLTPFDQALEVVAFSVFNYLLVVTLLRVGWLPSWLQLPATPGRGGTAPSLNSLMSYLYVLSLFSVLVGLIAGSSSVTTCTTERPAGSS